MINDPNFSCLLIETSTDRGLVSCWHQQKILFSRPLPFGASQSKFLMAYLAEEMRSYKMEGSLFTCIGIGVGPGSYTGIRVGVAVAQALAYSWQLPLLGLVSLDGFIPDEKKISFASIIDARIGGAYVQKGLRNSQGDVKVFSSPELVSLEGLGSYLQESKILVTPSARLIKSKLDALYPDNQWEWQEREPSKEALFASAYEKWKNGESASMPLELLYLQKTEAERQKERREFA